MYVLRERRAYPTESDGWILTVLVGGVLSLLSSLIVPAFFAVRLHAAGHPEQPRGRAEPLAFGNRAELFVDGIRVFLILLAHMLVPLLIAGATVGSSIAALVAGGDAGVAAGLGGLLTGLIVTFVLALVFGSLAVAGTVNLAHEGDLGAAFDVGTTRIAAFDADFAAPWLASIGVVGAIPLIGLVAVFLNFYALIVAAKLCTDRFVEATDTAGGRAGIEETVA